MTRQERKSSSQLTGKLRGQGKYESDDCEDDDDEGDDGDDGDDEDEDERPRCGKGVDLSDINCNIQVTNAIKLNCNIHMMNYIQSVMEDHADLFVMKDKQRALLSTRQEEDKPSWNTAGPRAVSWILASPSLETSRSLSSDRHKVPNACISEDINNKVEARRTWRVRDVRQMLPIFKRLSTLR